MFLKPAKLTGLISGALLLSACGVDVVEDYLVEHPERQGEYVYESELKNKDASVFGDGGFDLFNLGKPKKTGGGSGIAVNSYLWRASLDTVSFMPLSSADPFGGVIITDWYSPPESPRERYKMSVYILGRQLRADGIRVSVFRQQVGTGNIWQSRTVSKDTAVNLENQILTRARQLRLVAAKAN
ncbi:MAG: hypothetical protein CMM52_16820 [Rhodospirillaceae bacterium]|nr:hypothetical protein [Rhodospirillaceae bacterium]|tara:strand:- start:35527 stop:36078 length:552 start_codon:yes stop_codon:yes gene_type:complete